MARSRWSARLLRGACPRAARSADPWARNDTPAGHCEERSDEAISTHTGSTELLELVDQAGDHREALRPEGRVGGVEAEGRQQLAIAQAAAGPQQVEIPFGKPLMRV